MSNSSYNSTHSFANKAKHHIFGAPRNLRDKNIFHSLALIPLFAWIGLGADGLSSSAYGPEEAFRALGEHRYLAIFLAMATAFTVIVISYTYSRIIEHFPHGGGGYVVASSMLGRKAGVVSGCSLIVDYILTITVSIASCADALFSFLPPAMHQYKLIVACFLIGVLVVMNIRGVKESITVMAPIFMVFVLTHIVLITFGIAGHASAAGPIVRDIHSELRRDVSTIGVLGLFLMFIRAYSLGGGTYTGIEAVSNGLQIMREPKVQSGKRTMLYMASSLALTAGGLLFCYLLMNVRPAHGLTLNAVLASSVFGHWPLGHYIAVVTIFSEGALLLVAAQAGFIDGPRVMANMAVDSWFPHRLASFSEQLTLRDGVLMMGVCALAVMVYTHGSIAALVVMYSINVFLTFSLSQLGMLKLFATRRKEGEQWRKNFAVHMVGLALCATILVITVAEKFIEGGWLTLLVTSTLIALCYAINSHYSDVRDHMMHLDKLAKNIPDAAEYNSNPVNKDDMTAIQLVGGYSGFGVHTLLSIGRTFPGVYKNIIFVSVAVVDQGLFKGKEGIDELEKSVEESLKKYVELARRIGYAADYRIEIGTDVVETATDLCSKAAAEFPRSTVFSGQLTFRIEKFYHRMLHNETAFAIQRRLQALGVQDVIMPINIDLLSKQQA